MRVSEVNFRDLRFLYDVSFMHGRETPPLSGSVSVSADRRIVQMKMDDRIQR